METKSSVVRLDTLSTRRLRGLDEVTPIWSGPTKAKRRPSLLAPLLRLLKFPVPNAARP